MRDSDKQILADHYLDFYQMAYSILGNETDVEDAVHDALVETMSKTFVNDPYRYCSKVLRNKCIRMLRRSKYILTEHLPEIPDTGDGVDEARLKRLWGYKDNLPERMRTVFDLYYEKGLSHSEISEQTNISLSSLKKLFSKGYKRLREQMIENEKKVTKTRYE